ncbi:hypothetical protein PanWU01x14_079320 [Parasponia andersonii]|uniref:Uncharacterized protein n=1 Tax=Parasponia andersonii TaxID=3476 RepID=A0A2P5DB95_PARAD|nr:hypothetical protein PanWU01x14_079320 [Parasponia andersonii]
MEDDDSVATMNDIPILQEASSSSFQLWVELPELDNIRFQREDVEPTEVDNIDELIRESRVVTQDDFLVDDGEFEDNTLEEYDDEEIEIIDSDTSSEENNDISDNEAVHHLVLSSIVVDPTPKEKMVREETRGIVIENKLRRTKTNKLKVKHDEHTGKPVLKNGKMFLNLVVKMSSAGSVPPGSGLDSGGSDPKGKRMREETRGIVIEKELRRTKTNKLKVKHDELTGKPVLKNGKIFLNLLAKLLRDTISASTLSWKDVKMEDLDLNFQ